MEVRIKTPSRLHFGILDLSGDLDRRYGSVGLAIDKPGFELIAERNDRLEITGPKEYAERARRIISRIASIYDLPASIDLRINCGIPSHVGLSSTTQLTLALGKALTDLYDMEISILELAKRTGRGKNSGIGTYAFETGGFLVDGGRRNEEFPPLTFRYDFPEEWRFVIATPGEKKGPDEKREEKLFKEITASVEIARKACHLLVMKMIPAILERDIESFGEALSRTDKLTGEAFSPQQGGIFQSDAVSDIVEYMSREGAFGSGQSSWGPTVYGLIEDDAQGTLLKEKVEKFLQERNLSGEVSVVRPNNRGALIEVE